MHPETRAVHPDLATWADTQPPEVQAAAARVLMALWMLQANKFTERNFRAVETEMKALADAVAKAKQA